MRDLVVFAMIVVFFALGLAYVRWCDRIIGPDADDVHGDAVAAGADADEAADRAGETAPS